jgi:hypothetical protein
VPASSAPLRIGPASFVELAILGAVLDTLPPSPSTALLSAQKASERLREIVEGFFFRRLRAEDGKAIRRLQVKCPPRLGKTRTQWFAELPGGQEGLTGPPLAYNLFAV